MGKSNQEKRWSRRWFCFWGVDHLLLEHVNNSDNKWKPCFSINLVKKKKGRQRTNPKTRTKKKDNRQRARPKTNKSKGGSQQKAEKRRSLEKTHNTTGEEIYIKVEQVMKIKYWGSGQCKKRCQQHSEDGRRWGGKKEGEGLGEPLRGPN